MGNEPDYVEAVVEEDVLIDVSLLCSNCNTELEICDRCEQAFENCDTVFCCQAGEKEHICESCMDKQLAKEKSVSKEKA